MRPLRALELEAEPRSGVGDPGIVRCEIGVRHMVDEPRYADSGRQLITKFDAFSEQRRRAELFAVRRGAVGIAVLQSAPEAAIGEDTATPPEQVLDQRDAPGQAEIAGVRIARRVERTAESGRGDPITRKNSGGVNNISKLMSDPDSTGLSNSPTSWARTPNLNSSTTWVCAIAAVGTATASVAATTAERSIRTIVVILIRVYRPSDTERNTLMDFSPSPTLGGTKWVDRLPARRPAVAVEFAPDDGWFRSPN